MSKRVPLHATIKENGCWEVDSHTPKSGGYPAIFRNGIKVRTHVFIYSLVNGEIEKGKVIRHICNNKICINPDHLVQGTQAENNRDKILAGTQPRGITHGIHKLTEEDVWAIYANRTTSNRKLGKIFDISESNIRKIRSGRGWQHILPVKGIEKGQTECVTN